MPDHIMNAENQDLKRRLDQSANHLQLMMDLSSLSTEAKDVKYFAGRALEIIARANGWLIGQYWVTSDEDDTVTCAAPWFSALAVQEFRSTSLERRLSKGVGLPGRVWSNGTAANLTNVQTESGMSFTRAAAAKRAGIKGAFAFPIKNGPFVTGVFEFFTADELKIDQSEMLFYEKLGSFIGTFIAERSAEQVVREQEFVYRYVLDRAYSGFIGIDQNGVVTVWNTRSQKMFGWTKEEVIGIQIADFLIPARYRDAHIQGMFRYNAGGKPVVSNRVVRTPANTKEGQEKLVDLYIFPIITGETRTYGAFVADAEPVQREPEIVLD